MYDNSWCGGKKKRNARKIKKPGKSTVRQTYTGAQSPAVDAQGGGWLGVLSCLSGQSRGIAAHRGIQPWQTLLYTVIQRADHPHGDPVSPG